MGFEHGCFISHVSAQESLMTEFVESLVDALKSELEPYMDDPVFIDQERMRAGYRFNEALAHGICASACWIVVYVPQYWYRDYCMRELQAMLALERQRRHALGSQIDRRTAMIIPILLRGRLSELPANLSEAVHCLKFNGFTTATGDILRNQTYISKITDIAAYINEIYRLGTQLGGTNCADFVIPPLDGTLGSPPPPQAFPGYSSQKHEGA